MHTGLQHARSASFSVARSTLTRTSDFVGRFFNFCVSQVSVLRHQTMYCRNVYPMSNGVIHGSSGVYHDFGTRCVGRLGEGWTDTRAILDNNEVTAGVNVAPARPGVGTEAEVSPDRED